MPHPKVKIADNSGNEVAVTDNALNVNVAGATMSTGDIEVNSEFPAAAAITDNFGNPETTSVMSMGMAYEGSAWDRLTSTSGKLNVSTGTVTVIQDDSARTVNTISGFAIASKQLADGHNVTIDNSSGGSAVNIQDGGNTITVDGTVAVNTISGFATSTLQGGGLPAALSSGNLKVSIQEGNISGFATSALQPSLGTAGSASANVITVQGIASMTPLTVDLAGNNDVTVTGMVSDMDADVGTTAEKIHTASDVAIKRIDIQASPDNTGYIWVGGTNTAVGQGIRLAPGDFYSVDIDNTEDIQVLATVNGEDISFVIYT